MHQGTPPFYIAARKARTRARARARARARQNDSEIVTKLLQKMRNDPSLDQQDQYGKTPLFLATAFGKHELVKLLIEYGANILPNNVGWTPLHVAAWNNNVEIVKNPTGDGAN